jgi:hypothetical protein
MSATSDGSGATKEAAMTMMALVAIIIGTLPAWTPLFASADTTDQMIRAKCAREWPDDFRMRAHCEERQREALRQLETPAPASGEQGQVIRAKCAREWPDDFRMRAHCEERQREGLRTLSQPIQASPHDARIIRTKCAQEWPDDFRMRAYCENRQVEGLRKLGR